MPLIFSTSANVPVSPRFTKLKFPPFSFREAARTSYEAGCFSMCEGYWFVPM
jgi:hypothetical protein